MHGRNDRAQPRRQSRSFVGVGARNREQRPVSETAGQTRRRTMSRGWTITRRTALRGLGTAIALPWLDSMLPAPVLAEPLAQADPEIAPAATGALRMAFVYVPNGMHMEDLTPQQEGENFSLPSTLEPLATFQN